MIVGGRSPKTESENGVIERGNFKACKLESDGTTVSTWEVEMPVWSDSYKSKALYKLTIHLVEPLIRAAALGYDSTEW